MCRTGLVHVLGPQVWGNDGSDLKFPDLVTPRPRPMSPQTGLVPLAGLIRVLCCFFNCFRLKNKWKGRSARGPSKRARTGAGLKNAWLWEAHNPRSGQQASTPMPTSNSNRMWYFGVKSFILIENIGVISWWSNDHVLLDLFNSIQLISFQFS